MVRQNAVLAFDMGGTFIKAACVSPQGELLGPIHMTPSHSGEDRETILDSLCKALAELREDAQACGLGVLGAGASTPGPFDFTRGCSRMTQKFQAIYEVDLAGELRARLGLPEAFPFRFIQDGNAFLAGEQLCGAVRGVGCCAGVTLGTGLGFATMVNGELLTNGFGTPYIALYRQPFGDGILEDVVSARGICRLYREWTKLPEDAELSAKEVGRRAKEGDAAALDAMAYLGGALGQSIAYLLVHTRTERLVLGGQISKDFAVFAPALQAALGPVETLTGILPAEHPEDAALYGAAALYSKEDTP